MITIRENLSVKRTRFSALAFLRGHPLLGYFLLAFLFTWGWQIPVFAITRQQLLGPWVIFSPTLAGFVMAWVMEGRAGIVHLLRRVLIWRVRVRWYLVACLVLPAIWLGSIFLVPGALAGFRPPDPAFLLTSLGGFGYAFLYSLFEEEFGWRGFALPRLQENHGPLWGTLILGLLWGLWHLQGWAFFPNSVGAPSTLPAFSVSFILYVGQVAASAIFYTWIFNHSRGSLLLPALMHASANAAGGAFLSLFPALFPHPVIPVIFEIGMMISAAVVVVATRGRLGYKGYLQEKR